MKKCGYEIVFPVKCRLCGKELSSLTSLRNHIQRKEIGRISYSEYMEGEYGIRVVDVVRGNRGIDFPISCSLCGKQIKSLTGLARHLKMSHGGFDYEKYLLEFLNKDIVVPLEETVKCEICNRNCLNLALHILKEHGISKTEYEEKYGKTEFQKSVVLERISKGLKGHVDRIRGLSPRERMIKTLGVDDGDKAYNSWRESMSVVFTKEWFVKKYGKDEGETRYLLRSEKISDWAGMVVRNGKNRVNWSKISQLLFWEIYKRSNFKKVYFGELNHEYGCETNKNFDFVVLDNKKVIEFNGSSFHPNPLMSTEERACWRQVYTGKTASAVELQDAKKIDAAKKNGYEVFIVWDVDYRKSPRDVVSESLRFLTGEVYG